MVIKKNIKDTTWDKNWQGKIKWLSSNLEAAKKKELVKLIDEAGVSKGETDTLKTDYDAKNREYTDAKRARLNHVAGAKNEKARLNGGAVHHEDGAVDNKSTWTASMTTFSTAWNTSSLAHYPADYLNNLYDLKDQTFKITEDETVKLLSRAIYEVGKIGKDDYVNHHGITDATKKAEAESIFDNIKLCSQAIEAMNSKGASAKDLTKKTWDLPFTYSEEQKILASGKNAGVINARWNLAVANQPTFLSNVFKFVKEYLTADCIGKLDQKTVKVTEKETWNISKSGEVYTEEDLKDYGITLTDPKKTFLYRTNPKEVHAFKVEGGLNGWISLFNS